MRKTDGTFPCNHCLYKDICKYESEFREFMDVCEEDYPFLIINNVRCEHHKHKES